MRCSLCPRNSNFIPPNGPPSSIMFIGEAPGIQEDKKGIPFIGPTGRELNEHYLPLASLKRESSYISNAIKCLPDRPKGKLDLSKEKDRDLLMSCSDCFLHNEIRQIKPKLLVPMGVFACYAIDPDINLELHHGLPLQTAWGTVFPMWHPAGGVHEPKKMLQIRNDWINFKRFIRGNLSITVDQYPNPDYREATESDVGDIYPTQDMAADTEHSRSKGPYFITWSQQPGSARLIRASDTSLIWKLQEKLDKWEASIYFHNWPYDWSITEDMGLKFPVKFTRDTMAIAYHLGNLPQGLKILAYRLLGMEMQDFEDLVKPYSSNRVYDYYLKAYTFDWDRPEEQLIQDSKTGKWKLHHPQSLKTKLKRLFTDIHKNPNKNILDVWDTWECHHTDLEEKCGPYTGLDIADVPYDLAMYYSCRDSDATIRLVPVLNKMRESAMSGKLQEMWS